MNDKGFAYLDALLGRLAHLNLTTLLALLLVCAMAGIAVKTTAFTLAKSLGKSTNVAARVSFCGMALTFVICLMVTGDYALRTLGR